MALLQTTIDDEVKARADEVFARNGLTTAMAVRAMVTQVADTGVSPFDGFFLGRQCRAPLRRGARCNDSRGGEGVRSY